MVTLLLNTRNNRILATIGILSTTWALANYHKLLILLEKMM